MFPIVFILGHPVLTFTNRSSSYSLPHDEAETVYITLMKRMERRIYVDGIVENLGSHVPFGANDGHLLKDTSVQHGMPEIADAAFAVLFYEDVPTVDVAVCH